MDHHLRLGDFGGANSADRPTAPNLAMSDGRTLVILAMTPKLGAPVLVILGPALQFAGVPL